MRNKITHRTLATVVLILIIIYGFLKNRVRIFYSDLIDSALQLFGFNTATLIETLNGFSQTKKTVPGILGWFIYYPSYFLLHIAFIYLLFAKQKQTRNYLIFGLTGLIILLIALSLLGKILGLNIVYEISYDAFQKLFGLPFILLFIEGGRILYKDVFGEDDSPPAPL